MRNRFTAVVAAILTTGLPLSAQDEEKPAEQALKKLAGELAQLIKGADTDSSGTLTRAEFAAFEGAVRKRADAILDEIAPSIAKAKAAKDLKKYDKDRDGRLGEEETKALNEDRRLREIRDFDWDEDGQLNEREKTAMKWAEEGRVDKVFRRVDTDGKGELSEQCLSAGLGYISKLVKRKK